MKPRRRLSILLADALAALSSTVPCVAQDLELRAYRTLATRLNFLVVSLGYSESNVLVDPSVPIEDLQKQSPP